MNPESLFQVMRIFIWISLWHNASKETHLESTHEETQYLIFVDVLVEVDGNKNNIGNTNDDKEDKLEEDGDTDEDDIEEGIDLQHNDMIIEEA